MKWKDIYDDETIRYDYDKSGVSIYRGDTVIWASVSKPSNRPYLNEGKVIGFVRHPSMIEVYLKTKKNRIVKHLGKSLLKIL